MGLLHCAFRDGALQSGEMTAVQVADEIARTKLTGATFFPHNITAIPQLCLCGFSSSLAANGNSSNCDRSPPGGSYDAVTRFPPPRRRTTTAMGNVPLGRYPFVDAADLIDTTAPPRCHIRSVASCR
jgi:hypothetical protein